MSVLLVHMSQVLKTTQTISSLFKLYIYIHPMRPRLTLLKFDLDLQPRLKSLLFRHTATRSPLDGSTGSESQESTVHAHGT